MLRRLLIVALVLPWFATVTGCCDGDGGRKPDVKDNANMDLKSLPPPGMPGGGGGPKKEK